MRLLGPRTVAIATRSSAARRAAPTRTKFAGGALKSSARGGRTLAVLPKHAPVEVVAESGRFARVRFRGTEGYIARWLLET
jgi:hypothetical protein